MSAHKTSKRSMPAFIAVLACVGIVLPAFAAATARAEEGPVKLVYSSHFGWEVDNTTNGAVCPVGPTVKDECQQATPSSQPGGFYFPESVAGAPNGDIYVADQANRRVQELTDTGEFVLMFGKEVNATTHGDTCTEAEVANCQAGVAGPGAGALGGIEGVAVDPVSENVYVRDLSNWRVDEYTPAGQFVLMIGREVNRTKDETNGASEAERNLCTAVSKDICTQGKQAPVESTEKGAFKFLDGPGDLITVGDAPEHLLYVGDEHRIQKFNEAGEWRGEIPLPTSSTTAIAVDSKTAYVVSNFQNTIREFDLVTGVEDPGRITVLPKGTANKVEVDAIALDAADHLAVLASSEPEASIIVEFGSLYQAGSGHFLTSFTVGAVKGIGFTAVKSMGFNGNGELFGAVASHHEISRYVAEPVAEVLTGGAQCAAGPVRDSSDTLDCALLGEVNPYSVPDTGAWFEWGRTCSLGASTPAVPVATVDEKLAVSAPIDGLRPHESFCYQIAGVDQNVQLPEELTGEQATFKTPIVPAKIVGEASVLFVKSFSAVLFGELNPENTSTEYFFEYAAAAGKALEECHEGVMPYGGVMVEPCPGVSRTAVFRSSLYGRMGATLEASGLQPSTLYNYRLAAVNEVGESSHGEPAGSFTTAPASTVRAETLPASSITATSALASGTVNPGGQPAVYTFELGVDEGAATQYATVISGQTGASTSSEPVAVALTGLQPGTKYAYRVSIHSGYGTAQAPPTFFTTSGQPEIIQAPTRLPMLSASLGFPGQAPAACKRGYTREKHGKCVKQKSKKKTKKTNARQKTRKK